jgi:hypothetical protein
MKGIEILLHSIRQVFGNLDGALKVSAVPYAIQVVVAFLIGLSAAGAGSGMGSSMDSGMPAGGMMAGMGFAGLVILIVVLITSLWMAVAWHRYILLSEQPTGFIPPFNGDRILAYFLRSLGYGILLILIGMVLGLVMGFILSPIAGGGRMGLFMILMSILVYLPLVILGFRLTAGLPGAALGAGTDFMAGWQATQGATVDIAVLSVFVVGAHLIFGLIDFYLLSGVWVLSFLWNAIVGWLIAMIGISVLTTLYGHYVEKRPLATA